MSRKRSRGGKGPRPSQWGGPAVALTGNQLTLLEAMVLSDYGEVDETDAEAVQTWTWDAVEGLPVASRGGVVSRAHAAGLVVSWSDPLANRGPDGDDFTGDESTVTLTDLGYRSLRAVRPDLLPVPLGGWPRRLK